MSEADDHGGADAGVGETRTVTHRCNSKHDLEPCEAVRYSDGSIDNTCGEPCSWIMGKSGHGEPPWENLPGNIRRDPTEPDTLSHQPAPVAANASAPYESSETFQNCLGEMLRVLGMSDAAQPKSPHDVFQSAIAEMKRQLGNASAEARLREALGWLVDAISQEVKITKETPLLKCRVEAGIEALSAHTHASDCDKQGK